LEELFPNVDDPNVDGEPNVDDPNIVEEPNVLDGVVEV
jgi:hypothetical protein